MFNGFSERTLDFLWGIRLNNNRGWFLEHKQAYLEHLQRPMGELAGEVWKRMTDKFGLDVGCHVSRIYKDARYSHSEGLYRDRLWFSLRRRSEEWTATPVFFFELEPDKYTYGMGYYSAPAQIMREFRRRIDAGPAEFERIAAFFNGQSEFLLYGDMYKRSKGVHPPDIARWYDRKNIGVIAEKRIGDELFSKRITEMICEGFERLLPLYSYLWSLEDPAAGCGL